MSSPNAYQHDMQRRVTPSDGCHRFPADSDGSPTTDVFAMIDQTWEREFRSVCTDESIEPSIWRYCGAGSAAFLGTLAMDGVEPQEVWAWVKATSNGRGAHGITQGDRVLRRIARWRVEGFASEEALAFSAAGVTVAEASKMAVRDTDGRLAREMIEGLHLLAALRA
ncbi:hypothetical protein [Nocardioides piscis]|uniref:Uncharacterized protein n=1 Tax=Nocardioides piscis TaxID=2714938 RepID=A0A6G7YDR0_9ACTN|nr:hypothetical protein [Nocardioides piscis]QIK74747.1 hypothetical protein G7071_04215 [Nocardioides piscis]